MDASKSRTVSLRPMTPAEFRRYCDWSHETFYADAAARSGEPIQVVRARVGEPPAEMHPDDLWYIVERRPSPGQLGEDAGFFWIRLDPAKREAFGFKLHLEERFRGQGLGRQAMEAGRELLRAQGIRRLRICVFEDNRVARELYRSLGFQETEYRAGKRQYRLEIEV